MFFRVTRGCAHCNGREAADTAGISSSRVNLALTPSAAAAEKKRKQLDRECAEDVQFLAYWRSNRGALRLAPMGDAARRLEAVKDRLAEKFATRRTEADFLGC